MGLSRFIRRARWDEERGKELEDYLAHEIADNIARGMTADEATHAAHRKLGNLTRIREEIYEMNTIPFLDTLWQDIRYGLRILRKNPTFALVAILTLALGTGANAAIFQLVNALRLRSLPVEEPQDLVSLRIDQHGKGVSAERRRVLSSRSLSGGAPQPIYHIVGLVRDAKYLGVREERTAAVARFSSGESSAMFLPIAYLAVSQNATPPPDLRIVVRADAPLLSLSRTLTHAITEAAPGAAVSYSVVTNPDLAMMLARACNHCLPLSGPLDYRQEDV